jgi:hypothetical protein
MARASEAVGIEEGEGEQIADVVLHGRPEGEA